MAPANLVAFLDFELGRTTGANLKDRCDRLTRRKRGQIHGFGIGDARDRSVCTDEDDIQRDERILHPERHLLRRFVGEQHAAVSAKRLAKHEAPFLLFRARCNFNHEMMHARNRANCQGHFAQSRLRPGVDCLGWSILRRRLRATGNQRDEHDRC